MVIISYKRKPFASSPRKNLVTGDDFVPRLVFIVVTNLKGGDLMSSDKRFGSKDLVSVWRAEEQPSGCA